MRNKGSGLGFYLLIILPVLWAPAAIAGEPAPELKQESPKNSEELVIIGQPNFWRTQRNFERREFERLERIFVHREQKLDVIGKAMAGDGGALCKTCTMADILTKEAVRGRSAW